MQNLSLYRYLHYLLVYMHTLNTVHCGMTSSISTSIHRLLSNISYHKSMYAIPRQVLDMAVCNRCSQLVDMAACIGNGTPRPYTAMTGLEFLPQGVRTVFLGIAYRDSVAVDMAEHGSTILILSAASSPSDDADPTG